MTRVWSSHPPARDARRLVDALAWRKYAEAETLMGDSGYSGSIPLMTSGGIHIVDAINAGITRLGPFCLAKPSVLIGIDAPLFVLLVLGASGAGVGVAMLTLFVVSSISRRVALRHMGLVAVLRILTFALGRAWLWAITASVIAGLLVWYVGFDRIGWARPLTDGFFPTRVQAIAAIVAWGVVYGVLGFAMLSAAIAEYIGLDDAGTPRLCLRCLYPVESIPSACCPECGALIPGRPGGPPAIHIRSTRRAHRTIGRSVVLLTAIVLAVAAAVSTSPRPRRWLLLLPRKEWVYSVSTMVQLRENSAVRFDTIFGQWWVAVRRDHRTRGDAISGHAWTVSWIFKGAHDDRSVERIPVTLRHMDLRPASGTAYASDDIPDVPVGMARFTVLPSKTRFFLTLPNGIRSYADPDSASDATAQNRLVAALGAAPDE